MRRIITILLLIIPFVGMAQTYPPIVQGSKLYQFKNGLRIDSGLFIPRRDTYITDAAMKAAGMLLYRTADSLLYYLKGNTMTPLTTGKRIDSLTLTVENIAALRATSFSDAPDKKSVYVRGYYTAGDGGGGNFYWSDTATAADNGGTIIKATSITTGRWKRIITGDVDFKMFGARGDSVSDDSDPVQRAIDAFQEGIINSGAHFIFSKGRYLIANVKIKSGTYIDAYQAARDNFSPNVPVTIAAFGNPDYIIDVDSLATNWSIKNLSIDGDYTNQPQLIAAVRLRGSKGYFTGNNVNRCAQTAVWSEAGIVFIEKNGIYGWYGSTLPTFTGINDFRGALHVPSFGDAYITKNEIGAGLNYFTSTVTPRDATNGRIVALSLGSVFGGTGWVSENFFENGDKAVAIGNSLYCEFYFNRYELSAIGGLHIYGPAQYLGFTGERFADNSLTADSAADNIIIGIGAAGRVVFSHPTFERLVNGAIPNSGFKSRWGLSNFGSVEIDLTTPKIDTSYITGLVNNVDVAALPVRQVVGQYDPINPIYNSITAGGTGNRTPWSNPVDTLGAVKLSPGTKSTDGNFTGQIGFLRANGDLHSTIGFDNFADLTFSLNESNGKFVFAGGEGLFAKPGASGLTIQSNDAAGDPHINMQTGTKTAGYTLDHTTGDINYIASGGFTFTTGNGTPFTSIGGNGTFAKAGGLDFSLISDNTGSSNFRIASDVLSANSFNIGFNNVTGNTAITGSADITIGNNWKYDVNGFNYIPTTPTSAGGDTTFHFLAWNHADQKVIIKSNVYWDSTKVKSYVASSSPAAITSLNGLTDAVQTFSTGTTGTDFNIVSTSGNHVFNIPDASSGVARGLMTNTAQTFSGNKTSSAWIGTSSLTCTNTSANLYLPIGAGAQSISSTAQYLWGGATTIYSRVFLGGGNTSTTISANSNYSSVLLGNNNITTPATGTNKYLSNMTIYKPFFTSGGATVTNMANLILLGTPSGATNNYNLLTDSGTVALNPTLGNVGIGVTTPTSKLHVGGNATITDTVTVIKTGSDTFNPYFRLQTGAKGAAFQMGDPTASESTVQLWTTGTGSGPGSGFNERMRVGPIGVSMGTTANLGALTVGTFGLNNTGITSTGNTGGVFNMYTGGYPLSGIGIGAINMGSNTTGSTIVNTAIIKAMAAANWSAGTSYPTYMSFSTTQVGSITAAERMRITDSGNVAINKTTASAKLDVNGDVAAVHYKGNSATPTFTPSGSADAILGTGYSLTITGNDAHMIVTITTGTGITTSGTLGNIVFAQAYEAIPTAVSSPGNVNALAAHAVSVNCTNANDMLIFSSANLSPSTDYIFNIITGQ